MAAAASITAFLAFCAQPNARFVHPIPERTPYEQMLVDLDSGDPAVQTAFNWTRQTQNASEQAVRAEWRRYAEAERAAVRQTVRVNHALAAPPAAADLAELGRALDGAADELLLLYQRHNGASLFVDGEDGGSGLFLYPLAEMAGEQAALNERLDGPAMETVEDGRLQVFGRPDWLDGALVFGGFGYAPERLLLSTEGEYRGQVFLFSHDPLQLLRICASFGELLDQLRQQPVVLLGAYGGPSFHNASAYQADA